MTARMIYILASVAAWMFAAGLVVAMAPWDDAYRPVWWLTAILFGLVICAVITAGVAKTKTTRRP
jgi:peptidoglycan/LPS O-acetylase OafA/YrhL